MWVYDPETLGFLTVNDSAMTLYGGVAREQAMLCGGFSPA